MLEKKLRNKVFNAIGIIFLLIFSFYYTNKSVDIIREQDSIMKNIRESTSKYQIPSEDAEIIGDKIIPGKKGQEIDYQKSYLKMKQYGSYNELLTVFKETKPTVSLDDYYDKYVIRGNSTSKSVALVFKITSSENLSKLVSILKNNDVTASFFLDGIFIEENPKTILDLNNYELELLSYDNKYDKIYFTSSVNYLASLTKKPPKYCYAEYSQKEVLELCSSLKLHTIIPTIKVGENTYSEVKNRLTDYAIISIPTTNKSLNTLDTTIKYLKQKGYKLLTLDSLLSESSEK